MKLTLKVYKPVLVLITGLVLSGQLSAAGDPPLVKKTKTYSKSYAVGSNDKVSFDNKFGELKINTWNKNEVKVDVVISAEANTDAKALAILDGIHIEDGKGSNGVYFKTNIDNKKGKDTKWEKGEKQGFSIDYTVYMPASNPLNLHNEFGPTTIGDYSGELTVVSKFGSLTAGKLTNAKKVTVEFGQANIASFNNGDLTVKFSKANVKNLSGTVNSSFEFSGVKIDVDNNIKNLTVKNSYTDLYLDLSTNLSAVFDIDTHFGELNNKSNYSVKEEGGNDNNHGPKFNHQYSGKAGSGGSTVKIKSSFGEVTLGHNLPDNVIEDKKKNKKKTTSI